LGLSINLMLAVWQFWFRPEAWYLAIAWIVAGYILYYSYFVRITEKVKPQVLPLPASGAKPSDAMKILLPINNPDNVKPLLDVAMPIAKYYKGQITVLAVVQVPRQTPIEEALNFSQHGKAVLEEAQKYARNKNFRIRTRICLAHRVVDGIIDIAQREDSDLLILGWKGYARTGEYLLGEITDYLLRYNPCDVLVLKPIRFPFKRVLFATGGGPNTELVARVIKPLVKELKATLTLATSVPLSKGDEYVQRGREIIETVAKTYFSELKLRTEVLRGKGVAGAIAKASKDYELVVMGASREPLIRKIVVGDIPFKVAKYSPSSVMLVKRYEGPLKSWFKRTFG